VNKDSIVRGRKRTMHVFPYQITISKFFQNRINLLITYPKGSKFASLSKLKLVAGRLEELHISVRYVF
jgi:hypothetical protein